MKNLKIALITAIGLNHEIGFDNKLPWNSPSDLKNFKELTQNSIIIMGRKTFDSIGKPLPNRDNYIFSNSVKSIAGCKVITSFDDVDLNSNKEVFIIGGVSIYETFLNLVDRMFITEIDCIADGDAYFPKFDENKWEKKLISKHFENESNEYNFEIYEYTKKSNKK
jgi:dihydrofolate reductase